jgi:hypothetical protein
MGVSVQRGVTAAHMQSCKAYVHEPHYVRVDAGDEHPSVEYWPEVIYGEAAKQQRGASPRSIAMSPMGNCC